MAGWARVFSYHPFPCMIMLLKTDSKKFVKFVTKFDEIIVNLSSQSNDQLMRLKSIFFIEIILHNHRYDYSPFACCCWLLSDVWLLTSSNNFLTFLFLLGMKMNIKLRFGENNIYHWWNNRVLEIWNLMKWRKQSVRRASERRNKTSEKKVRKIKRAGAIKEKLWKIKNPREWIKPLVILFYFHSIQNIY